MSDLNGWKLTSGAMPTSPPLADGFVHPQGLCETNDIGLGLSCSVA
jgi:hypothetical protein